MRENVRNVSRGRAGRERWEFSLDGRQIAAVAVGALVIVGSSFVLGMNAGKGLARQAKPPAAADSLAAFDTAHENLPTPPEPKNWEYEKLGGSRAPEVHASAAVPAPTPAPANAQARVPPPSRPLSPAGEGDGASAPVAVASPPIPSGAPSGAATPAPTPPPPAAPTAMERAIASVGGAHTNAASGGRYVIQVGSSPNRSEADRLAKRFAARGARVVAADVDGKRWYRVRLAARTYDSRADAEQALSRLSRETGLRGFVTAAQ